MDTDYADIFDVLGFKLIKQLRNPRPLAKRDAVFVQVPGLVQLTIAVDEHGQYWAAHGHHNLVQYGFYDKTLRGSE